MAMRYPAQTIGTRRLTARQIDILGMALLSGMLVMPVALLLTKLIATPMPPLAVAPSPPADRAPASTPLALWENAPPMVLSTESVPPPLAPSVAAPDTLPPPAALPGAAPSFPLPSATAGAETPALAGAIPLALPGARSFTHVPLKPHAAVVALLTMMRNGATKPKPGRHSAKASVATHPTQAAKDIPPGVMANALDPLRPNFGVLGRPATTRTGTPGLNGTGMRHRL